MPRHIREVKRDGASSKEERWRERKRRERKGERRRCERRWKEREEKGKIKEKGENLFLVAGYKIFEQINIESLNYNVHAQSRVIRYCKEATLQVLQ